MAEMSHWLVSSQDPLCACACRWSLPPTLQRPPSQCRASCLWSTVALWSCGPTTPRRPSSAWWWCRCPRPRPTSGQGVPAATAPGSATASTQVSSAALLPPQCWPLCSSLQWQRKEEKLCVLSHQNNKKLPFVVLLACLEIARSYVLGVRNEIFFVELGRVSSCKHEMLMLLLKWWAY